MDFYQICTREIEKGPNKGHYELYPDFRVGRSNDLMIRGKHFYAIWDEAQGLWTTDEYAVQRLVDDELQRRADELKAINGLTYHVKFLRSFSTGGWKQFRTFLQNVSDNSHDMDNNLTFSNTEVKKSDYVSRRLPYPLEDGSVLAWDELVGTLYSVEERAKIEWAIGAVVAGDAKKIQKFVVLYGPAGTGKSTILNIIQSLFEGYLTTFDAKALGSSGSSFSTEVFKSNPLVAIQHDGDLSRIEDNTKLNSIISHEDMPMNEKYKPSYTSRVNAFLFMGTNQPVKISDAKSGIIRRLIDVHPTGVKIPINHYNALMSQIDFELGAIAKHCLDVYQDMGKNYYNSYRPLEMMLQTDVFFNFIEANFDIFKEQDSTTLKQAYILYKEFCAETGIERVLPQYKFRSELTNYFDDFKERGEFGGVPVRSLYLGFNANKFKTPKKEANAWSLVMEDTVSIFDELGADWPAQLSKKDEYDKDIPAKRWTYVKTTLADLDTTELHFVKVPENLIVIDFDLKDDGGKKSLERNLEAASIWPATYGELSQGGGGVHLHYFYDGDVSQLSSVYSEGIEVKTLLGDASLRRRLTHCNNVPVASISSGLPLKEKKVLDDKTIKSERGLRDLINRNLRKEIMPGTKVSVDFIAKILNEAFESGMTYDVSDMRPTIIAFAARASNQNLQSLKIVQRMKFKSLDAADSLAEPPQDGEPERYSGTAIAEDGRLVFWDIEVYPNLFILCWKFQGSDQIVKMINPSAADLMPLLKLKLVGFNNRRYDNHILYAAIQGYDNQRLYELSQKIISNEKSAMFGNAYNISYADIYDFSILKQPLKKFMIDLGIHKMEMELPWDQPVPEELWEKVVEYCCNDVLGTEATFEARKQDFVARQILSAISGLGVNDTTARHAAQIIFGKDRNPQAKFVYTDLSTEFPGYVFDLGKSTYKGEDPSEGGYVYAEPGMYENVAELDVASMHPTTIGQLNLFGEYTQNFIALKDARLAIKVGDYTTARQMFGGKLEPFLHDEKDAKALSDALKIVINSVYGLTAAKFENPFKHMKNRDNIVAKRGALFMIDLKLACQEKGMRVVHIKTDSIKIADATQEDIDFITAFGAKYGYDFEHETTYEKFCLVNDAVYIARDGGTWIAKGAQFQHPYVYKHLFSNEDITFEDMCETKQVTQGAIYLDFDHDKPMVLPPEGMHHVGRIGRFVPVQEGQNGAVMYRIKDDKHYAVTGTKGHLWLEADMAKEQNPNIDMSYFDKLVDEAVGQINKYGSFEEFVR